MGYRFDFTDPLGHTDKQLQKYEEIRRKYGNKVYLTRQEMLEDKKKLDKELEAAGFPKTQNTGCRFGTNTLT